MSEHHHTNSCENFLLIFNLLIGLSFFLSRIELFILIKNAIKSTIFFADSEPASDDSYGTSENIPSSPADLDQKDFIVKHESIDGAEEIVDFGDQIDENPHYTHLGSTTDMLAHTPSVFASAYNGHHQMNPNTNSVSKKGKK